MAFGFLGDIIEEVGEIILPRGTRGATIGGAIGGPVGAIGGAITSQALSQATGKSAVTTPTVAQAPTVAPERAMSGETGPNVYRGTGYMPTYTAGFSPGLRDIGTTVGGAILEQTMDLIPDISISKFFGDANGLCGGKKNKLVSVRQTCDGPCLYVTSKQQKALREMMKYMDPADIAYSAGISVDQLIKLVCTDKPRRRKGISAADMRTATRVNNRIVHNYQKLESAFKRTAARRTTTRK